MFGAAAKSAIVLVAFLVALASATTSFQMAAARSYPSVAADLWPSNGWAKVNFSRQFLKVETGPGGSQQFPTATDDRFVALSRDALMAEPLAADAVRNLGLHYASNGDTERARSLMNYAATLSRRDELTNFWLSQDYAMQGDEVNALRFYDYLLRTNTRSRAVTLPVLAQTLAQENAPEAYYRMLSQDPPWHNAFWASVIEDGSALANAAELRTRLHGNDVPMAPQHDSLILGQLVQASLIDEAFTLFDAVAEDRSRPAGELLRDAGFNSRPQFAPFEWIEVAESEYGSSVAPEAGVLRISALEGAAGVVAQQLVQLENGQYLLSIDAKSRGVAGLADGIELSASLRCAELSGARTFDQTADLSPDEPARFDVESECSVFWLSLTLASKSPLGADVEVESLSLKSSES